MRSIDADHEYVINKATRRVDMRVRIEDGDGTLQDMTSFKGSDWVIDARWSEDIDTDCMAATIKLKREIYNDSLAPTMRTPRTNLNAAGSYDPLLDLGRQVQIQVRYASEASADALAWITLFDGYISTINWGAPAIILDCRDKFSKLQDTWIETETVYSDTGPGEPLESVLQQILNDNMTSPPTLYTPTSPGWYILQFVTSKHSIADQIKLLVDQIGWKCRYKWHAGTSAFRLTLYEPDRAKTTSDRTFTEDNYIDIGTMDISLKDVRNAVTVSYADTADLALDGTPIYKTFTDTSPTSITAFGRRWMGVGEDSTSNINTLTEATDLAGIIIHDLSYPKIGKRVEIPFFAFIELEDMYTFTANDIHSTTNIEFTVTGYEHILSEKTVRTNIELHESDVIGQSLSWYSIAAGPGMGPSQSDRIGVISDLAVAETTLGFNITWKAPQDGAEAYTTSRIKNETVYEVYITATGGTPASTDLIGTTRSTQFYIATNDTNIPAGYPMLIHVRAVTKGNPGSFATWDNAYAHTVGNESMNPDFLAGSGNIAYSGNTNATEIEWNTDTGTYGTDFMSDTGVIYTDVTSTNGDSFLLLK